MYNSNKKLYLIVYFNLDYISNKLNRKLILKYIFIIDEELIVQILRKQKLIAIFITKTKYITLFIYIRENL